ncbi:MAG: hypothetical protein SVM80_08040 [Halobacteriota archaeon]|nr:hypothetical protein [Halobacteriota archaeon]
MKDKKILTTFIIVAIIASVTSVSFCIMEHNIPIVKVKFDVVLDDEKPKIQNVEVNQSYVTPLQRPVETTGGFPGVEVKAIINNVKPSYWASKDYVGEGTYDFDVGFHPNSEPQDGDLIEVVIKIVDDKGKLMGERAKYSEYILWRNESSLED